MLTLEFSPSLQTGGGGAHANASAFQSTNRHLGFNFEFLFYVYAGVPACEHAHVSTVPPEVRGLRGPRNWRHRCWDEDLRPLQEQPPL